MSVSICVSIPVFIFLTCIQNINYPGNLNCKDPSGGSIRTNKEDAIVGRWMTVEKSLEVEVYRQDNSFKAKIIWFKVQDTTRPLNTRMDEQNPNPALRNRKWLGMEILRSLRYNAEDDEWQNGIIYDPKHGREWDSVAWINDSGLLKVKGYWVFKWISETLVFERV